MAIVIWTRQATNNIRAIHDYKKLDSAFHAKKLVDQLVKQADTQLSSHPSSGRMVEEFENSIFFYFKQISYKKYRIIYEYSKEQDIVTIITVVHSRQQLTPEMINK